MLNGDVARYRNEDLVRAAEAHRMTRSITARRRAARASGLRLVIATAAALLPIPVKQ